MFFFSQVSGLLPKILDILLTLAKFVLPFFLDFIFFGLLILFVVGYSSDIVSLAFRERYLPHKFHLLRILVCFLVHPLLLSELCFIDNFAELLENFIDIEPLSRDLVEVAEHSLLAVSEYHDLRRLSQELKLVSHKNDTLVLEGPFDSIVEDAICNGRVNSGKRIIQKVDVSVLVNSTRQTDSCFLPAGNVDSTLANSSFPSIGK